MDSYRWSSALRNVFKDSYCDQLHKFSGGNLEIELSHVHECVQSYEDCMDNLREVQDLERLIRILDLSENEVEKAFQNNEDRRHRVYHLVKLFVTKCFRLNQEAKAVPTVVISTFSSNISEASEKQCLVPPARLDQNNVKHYIQPNSGCVETKDFKSLLDRILQCLYKIHHIFGMSGVGKSQLVRGICQSIDDNYPELTIWHVQCPEIEPCLIKRLQQFLNRLKAVMNPPIDNIAGIFEDLEHGNTSSFMDVLTQMPSRVLIVLEDVSHNLDKGLVRDLANQILREKNKIVQLLLVTRRSDAFYLNGTSSHHDDLASFKINGFTKQEAVEFLQRYRNPGTAKVEDLALELAYSPFRLSLARAFCGKHLVSYEEYYNGLGKNETIIRKEKEMLQEHPELGKHTYEVVLRMLEPKTDDQVIQKEVVKMMSFLNNVAIPDVLLGKFFRKVKDDIEDVMEESTMVKDLLLHLEEDFSASVNRLVPEYGQELLTTIHSDILTAVRFSMDIAERKKVVGRVLQAIAGLVKKDNRIRKSNTLLADMMNHFSRVTEFAETLLTEDSGIVAANFGILICLSRLNELNGFGSTQTSEISRDDWFEKAIMYLWRVSCEHNSSTSILGIHLRNDSMRCLLDYMKDKDPKDTAKKAYEALSKASSSMPFDECQEICDRFFPLTPELVEGMKQKCPNLQWKEIEDRVKRVKNLTADQYKVLQSSSCLLKPELLRKVFLVEYLASILHSRGRQLMYIKHSITEEERKRYEWYTDLGIQLCEIMLQKTGVNSIFGYMLTANNRLHRLLLTPPGSESDDEFLSRLQEARNMAQAALEVTGDFYEHGKYKIVPGNPFTKLNALKYWVKANTKIHKRKHLIQRFESEHDITACNQLYQVAKLNAHQYSFASNCMIQVAKYLAATGNYDEAIQAIEDGFNFKGKGIIHQRESNVVNYAWALYNSGRVLYATQGKLPNFSNHCHKFFTRCNVLKQHKGADLPLQWHENLDDIKFKLESIASTDCSRP